MCKALVLIITMLAPVPLAAATVNIARPRISLLSAKNVREICATVETACTTFERTSFTCACERHDTHWSPAVRITSLPLMFISHRMYHLHEMIHISDFQLLMRRHAEKIETSSFDSRQECEGYATAQSAGFLDVMRNVVKTSTLWRDSRSLADRK